MSIYETAELEPGEQTQDAPADLDVIALDTGVGFLIFHIETEYRAHLGRECEVSRELIGFADVTDWAAITDALRTRGLGVGATTYLPEFTVDDLPQ